MKYSIAITKTAHADISAILRYIAVDHYLVFYIANRDDLTVSVMRVMHGSRDIDSQLENLKME